MPTRRMPVMGKYLLLLLTLFFGVTFLLIPDNLTLYSFFPFSSQKLSFQTHLYFCFEHFTLIVLSAIISMEETKYKWITTTYFVIQCGHLLDYLLTYNSVWFSVLSFPMSVNTVGFALFAGIVFSRYFRTERVSLN